jgi:hypothetical protein
MGRSYHDGFQPTDGLGDFEFQLVDTPKGLAFDEQWNEAMKTNPPVIMITGWNEWWAGRWPDTGPGQRIANTYVVKNGDPKYQNNYVDNFDPEFSRDAEPMKGGFGDNYYYQMVDWIRKYKGVRSIPISNGNKTINISQDFSSWEDVGPEFRDTIYDTTHRKSAGNAAKLVYTNDTGRNDIDTAKVTRDKNNIYFYVKCLEDITPAEGENWMNLFIDADSDHSTGWEGYDYIINRSRDENTLSIERAVDNTWNWEKIGDAQYSMNGNELQLQIDASLLNLKNKKSFDFKWADNSTITGDPMQFMDLGDSAPDDRFNYRFISADTITTLNRVVYILIGIGIPVIVAGLIYIIHKRTKKDGRVNEN